MGAAASIQMVYADAMHWFKQYFDAQIYVDDFNQMDKDSDGGIEYEELQNWLKKKAANDDHSAWKMVISNQQVFKIAHGYASRSKLAASSIVAGEEGQAREDHTQNHIDHSAPPTAQDVVDGCVSTKLRKANEQVTPPHETVVDVDEFKHFLIHLFALSIMWVHFKSADEWIDGQDVGNETLTLDEFRLACRTFNTAQANTELSNERIEADFKLLDTNSNDSVDFLEVCAYCCKFIDPSFAEEALKSASPSSKSNRHKSVDYGLDPDENHSASMKKKRQNTIHSALKNQQAGAEEEEAANTGETAISHVAKEMDKNKTIAEFEQIKHSTEMALGVF